MDNYAAVAFNVDLWCAACRYIFPTVLLKAANDISFADVFQLVPGLP